jgi:Arc/MetJ-type ribon-helix-helix transcriptional regulator
VWPTPDIPTEISHGLPLDCTKGEDVEYRTRRPRSGFAAMPCCVPRLKRRTAMHLNLPTEIKDFVKGLVSQGRFDSEESAVVEGVRLLMTREKMRAEIQTGVDQLDNGQWSDEETVFREVNAEIDEIESSQQGS